MKRGLMVDPDSDKLLALQHRFDEKSGITEKLADKFLGIFK